jgi:hypothetical protein
MSEELRGVHCYWHTRTQESRVIRQLECAAWWLSILSWQWHAGPIDLLADGATTDRLDRLGLLKLYDRTYLIDEENLTGYDRSICFSLLKLLAMARLPGSVLVDPDAYLIGPLRLTGPGSHFAHFELADDYYADLRKLNNPAGVDLPGSLTLVGNTAVFRAASPALAQRISTAGLAFLEGNPRTPGRETYLHMTVAEMVLATHLTLQAGQPMANVFGGVWLPTARRWRDERPAFGHLWHAKRRGAPVESVLQAYRDVTRRLRVYGVPAHEIRAAMEQA